jgi:hypothetical protein
MMVTHDPCDLCVVVDVRQDPLTDHCMLLHQPTLLRSERTRLLEKPSRQTHLSDVVDEAAQVGHLLLLRRKP